MEARSRKDDDELDSQDRDPDSKNKALKRFSYLESGITDSDQGRGTSHLVADGALQRECNGRRPPAFWALLPVASLRIWSARLVLVVWKTPRALPGFAAVEA